MSQFTEQEEVIIKFSEAVEKFVGTFPKDNLKKIELDWETKTVNVIDDEDWTIAVDVVVPKILVEFYPKEEAKAI
jgi:hypothetical protein